MRVLVVNAGSSSLKLRCLDDRDEVVDHADVGPEDFAALKAFVERCGAVDAVGHRVVHGGSRFVRPVVVDDAVIAELESLVPLAPLHQPPAIAGIRAMAELLPDVPSVACFDTAFHATIPPEAATYPLPSDWRERFGLRRFGFHGLSHAYATRRAASMFGGTVGRLITCHLGAGSSVTAVVDGRSIDTTMGFTPNEGVPMATRSGSVDVGMLTWLLSSGVSATELDDGLQHRSGVFALAGDGDMRAVVAAADAGNARARLAVDVWLHRVGQAIASMCSSAGGIDALVFTGGIGEHAAGLRASLAERLSWLGLAVDPRANDVSDGVDGDITGTGATVKVFVVAAREDLEIARATRSTLPPPLPPPHSPPQRPPHIVD